MANMTINKDKTIDFYDRMAKEYQDKRTTDKLFWKDEFDIFKKLVKGKKVIDIGCGNGRDTPLFLKSRFDYLGIDASEGMLNIAKIDNPKANFQFSNFYKLNFPFSSFDGFWAAAVLLHVPKERILEVLSRISWIIKKSSFGEKGIGFISLKERNPVLNEGYESDPLFPDNQRYFAYYHDSEFRQILSLAGYRILKFHIKSEPDPKRAKWLCYFVKKV